MTMKNQKGITLLEMVVGVALMGIMGLVAASFFVFSAKNKKQITEEVEDKVDTILAERILQRDLKNSEPSFNNLLVPDDYGRRFFDHFTDVMDSESAEEPRTVTLEMGRTTEFIFLAKNERMGGTMIYTPASAYRIGRPPANPMAAATLTFVSLNKDNIVKRSDPAGQGRYWQVGNVLMLDTPTSVRPLAESGPDYSRPARSPIFLGVVEAEGPTRLRPLSLLGLLDRSNPMYPTETIDSEDQFLREVPPMGGAAPMVRLKVINMVKYYLQRDSVRADRVNLYRATYKGHGFPAGQLIAQGVSKVEFSRKSARDALIYFKIVRSE